LFSSFFLYFFFYHSGTPRYLHSFPTRRSSDLKYGNVFRPSGPRATPTVDGDRIYILGQHGDLVCFTADGKEVWRTDYVKDLAGIDRKSTRLNSSHRTISYAVFCLKKKKKTTTH